VNIGNTNIQCAAGIIGDNRKISVKTTDVRNAEDFIDFLESQLKTNIWELLRGSIISSVVPLKTSVIQEAIIKMTDKPPQLINEENFTVDFSGYNGVLGEDRMVCCEIAAKKYTPPVIVVDLGTATTVNIVNADKVFLGGAILPGIKMGLVALAGNTALLPEISDFSEVSIIGNSTQKCLVSGAVIGMSCAVEGYIDRVESELGNPPTVIITGGNARIIIPHCSFEFIYEPTLLIDGLFELYK
jgi:type III pantothenate kinase